MFNYFSITVRPRIALDYGGWKSAFKCRHLHTRGIQQNSEVNKEKPFPGFVKFRKVPLTAQ